MSYESVTTVESQVVPGVRLQVVRMSFGRRVELMRRVREMARRVECYEGGDLGQRMDAGVLRAEIERLYVEWGIQSVSGLLVDGVEADVAGMIERGPEEVFREALSAVRREAGLTDDERKN